MTPSEATVAVAALALVGTIISSILSYLNGQRLDRMHGDLNSRLTQLVEATRAGAFADGVAHQQGIEASKAASFAEGKANAESKKESS